MNSTEQTGEALAIVILAAGKGTRMHSALPKVWHCVAGKPMIQHVLETAAELTPQHIVMVIGEEMTGMKDKILALSPSAQLVLQKDRLGTGDAVKTALPQLAGFKGKILVLYGDTPFLTAETLRALVKSLTACSVAVLGFNPKDPAEYGRLIMNISGGLEAIVEFNDANAIQKSVDHCNSGVIATSAELLPALLAEVKPNNSKGEYYLTDIVAAARSRNMKCGVVNASEDEVLGINSRAQLALAEKMVQKKLRRKAMAAGVTLIAPDTVFFSPDTKYGRDIVIHPNVVFGAGVVIADDVEIRSFCHIEKASIGKNAIVGPFARLRPGTQVGENAHIGNFVEIKNSLLGEGVKIGHLSYIGDATVGSEANIGAGTITCNYDGFTKAKTIIGKGAFIGSNTSLIAPVTIEENAIVGAGSTVTKDVETNAILINEMPQKQIPNGATIYRRKHQKS